MKLIDGAQALSRRKFGKDVIGDMQKLYGGSIEEVPPIAGFDGRQRHLHSIDRLVHASAARFWPIVTVVNIDNLQIPFNAARWTALQAYRARAGVGLNHLMTEMRGLRAHQEWQIRTALAEQSPVRGGTDGQASVCAEHDERAFFTNASPGVGSDRGYLNAPAIAACAMKPPYDLPHACTVFNSRGGDLPEAARTLAHGYGELVFHADDPDATVARALGANSLDQLTLAWENAMEQQTPLAAGKLMLHALTEA